MACGAAEIKEVVPYPRLVDLWLQKEFSSIKNEKQLVSLMDIQDFLLHIHCKLSHQKLREYLQGAREIGFEGFAELYHNIISETKELQDDDDDTWVGKLISDFLGHTSHGNEKSFTLHEFHDYLFSPWNKIWNARNNGLTHDPMISITLKVLAARHLSKPGCIICPCIEIEVIGDGYDLRKYKTSTTHENGLNPVWDDGPFVFVISNPEQALMRFSVHDFCKDSNSIGQATYPVTCLKRGYRSIQLKNEHKDLLSDLSSLLIHIDIRRASQAQAIPKSHAPSLLSSSPKSNQQSAAPASADLLGLVVPLASPSNVQGADDSFPSAPSIPQQQIYNMPVGQPVPPGGGMHPNQQQMPQNLVQVGAPAAPVMGRPMANGVTVNAGRPNRNRRIMPNPIEVELFVRFLRFEDIRHFFREMNDTTPRTLKKAKKKLVDEFCRRRREYFEIRRSWYEIEIAPTRNPVGRPPAH